MLTLCNPFEVFNMSEFIRRRERVERVEYFHRYTWVDAPGAGFSFRCTADGDLLPTVPDAARQNAEAARSYVAQGTMIDQGIVLERWHYDEPAVIRCACRAEVTLDDPMTNTCTCGREYNGSGQLLAPREQWGEETGETLSDIFSGPDDDSFFHGY